MDHDHNNTVRYVLDAASIGVTTAALLKILPAVAAGLSIIWLCIQIGEWIYKKVKS